MILTVHMSNHTFLGKCMESVVIMNKVLFCEQVHRGTDPNQTKWSTSQEMYNYK